MIIVLVLGKMIPLIVVIVSLCFLMIIVLNSLSVLGGVILVLIVTTCPLIFIEFFYDGCEDFDCGDEEMVGGNAEGVMKENKVVTFGNNVEGGVIENEMRKCGVKKKSGEKKCEKIEDDWVWVLIWDG